MRARCRPVLRARTARGAARRLAVRTRRVRDGRERRVSTIPLYAKGEPDLYGARAAHEGAAIRICRHWNPHLEQVSPQHRGGHEPEDVPSNRGRASRGRKRAERVALARGLRRELLAAGRAAARRRARAVEVRAERPISSSSCTRRCRCGGRSSLRPQARREREPDLARLLDGSGRAGTHLVVDTRRLQRQDLARSGRQADDREAARDRTLHAQRRRPYGSRDHDRRPGRVHAALDREEGFLTLLTDTELLEFICNENNRDLEHLPGKPLGQ